MSIPNSLGISSSHSSPVATISSLVGLLFLLLLSFSLLLLLLALFMLLCVQQGKKVNLVNGRDTHTRLGPYICPIL